MSKEKEEDPDTESSFYKKPGFWVGIFSVCMLIGGIIALVLSLNKRKAPSPESFINMPLRSNALYNQLV